MHLRIFNFLLKKMKKAEQHNKVLKVIIHKFSFVEEFFYVEAVCRSVLFDQKCELIVCERKIFFCYSAYQSCEKSSWNRSRRNRRRVRRN